MIEKMTYVLLLILFIIVVISNFSDNELNKTQYEKKQELKDKFIISSTNINLPVAILDDISNKEYLQLNEAISLVEDINENMEVIIYG